MRWKCYCQKTATPVALLTTVLMMSWVGNKTNQGIQQPWYPKKDIRFVLTYLGLQSKIITKQLKACINKFYGCIDLRVIFHNTYRIKSLKRPKLYKANCWDCQDFYIGKTKRGLHDRKSKHFKAIISASSIHISTLLKVRNEKYSILVTDIIVLSCQCIHLPL